ncbi:hypothetical protein R1T16_11300 [Flavobacterium sp. DG1-102-2]|uniref:hypothetical protein n=1 Tax=Flavobacterium sp. DG1-102-2 TaxID=3081663 RepID=UPI002948D5A3|nr:hypothetical protein [Flavobacterium sp. DG1-102-2]MDV6169015.1 hypothetical protein [Flavobacterium sp. DG1-102-2]
MRKIFCFCLFTLFACKKENTTGTVKPTPKDSTQTVIEDIQPEKTIPNNSADYNGDETEETANIILTKKGKSNPIEDGTPDEYSVKFSGEKLPDLPIECCEAIIINEGDLDGDGADEFSVFQAPMNGCVYHFTTYAFKKGKWIKLIEPSLIPTACEEITITELEDRVFNDGGKIYIMETDVNDENFATIRKEAKML